MKEEPTDESLYAAYRRGDMAAFDCLYARYRQPLYLFLLRRGHTEAISEDVFHDGWLRVIDSTSSFDGVNFRAWIYAVTRNLSTDHFRKQKNHAEQGYDDEAGLRSHCSTQAVQEAVDCVALIKASLGLLAVEQRDVFLLKEEAGLSLQQIADVMAVGRETIKSRLRYAMNQLKQLMAECL